MNFKRCIFVGALMLMFLCCYHIMNQHIDELSRYQYASDENRDIILEYLDTDEINYLIDRQYQPEEFMRYLGIEGFNIRYVDWYNHTKSVENMKNAEIVSFVNAIHDKISFSTFKTMTENYSITQLKEFYIEENSYVNELSLIENPTTIHNKIESGKTLFTYVPKELVEIKDLPIVNQLEKKETIKLQKEAAESLSDMCKASFEINEKICGNMIITQGYLSFEQQETLYQKGLLDYGFEEVFNYVDYPGTSIYQLGNVVRIVPVGVDVEEEEKDDEKNQETDENQETEEIVEVMSPQQEWLIEHAKEYGFEFVQDSSKILDEFILQFVGIEEKNEIEGEE